MKPVAIDLFCGLGGWTKGFLAEGYEVIGFDIEHKPSYPGVFINMDVAKLCGYDLRAVNPVVIVASPPCPEFSVWGQKHFHPNPPWPIKGIELFNHTLRVCREAGCSFIIENVRPAQLFVGPATNRLGSFYLWGDVPPLMPQGAYTKKSAGLVFDWDRKTRKRSIEGTRYFSSASKERRESQSRVAEIPYDLANWIARCFKP